MSEQWSGNIPAFNAGTYALDDKGVFFNPLYSNRSAQHSGKKPSATLRRFVIYRQGGNCASCGIPEWATSQLLQLHRKIPSGLYSIYRRGCTL